MTSYSVDKSSYKNKQGKALTIITVRGMSGGKHCVVKHPGKTYDFLEVNVYDNQTAYSQDVQRTEQVIARHGYVRANGSVLTVHNWRDFQHFIGLGYWYNFGKDALRALFDDVSLDLSAVKDPPAKRASYKDFENYDLRPNKVEIEFPDAKSIRTIKQEKTAEAVYEDNPDFGVF